ncbi:hypothetical protein N7510_000949 [Penicillium lagena]|uniref:uncharacterized protein n=1 Tax=Penicillium lagena TaxID=94218 RepID=UPI002540B4B6|nr:uncharacterized protein N7510_000949 [Penicillium lagena]KAJ5624640.1 hypothetical protein N7510_000949 [Penicillium lagena]
MHPSASVQQEEREPFLLDNEPVEEEQFMMRFIRKILRPWSEARELITSEHAVGIFKCSLAYLLASLTVFIPIIGSVLGHQNGKHLVATITVYFHPARSQGSMYKALICAFVAFFFATFLSLSIFVMGGFGFIGWIKQRLGDPLVNVACSLASLASILVITKEGAVQTGDLSFTKIFQVLRMVLLGVGVSTAVSLSILPISARKKFRGDLSTLTGTVTLMLMSITESFLRGSDHELQTAEFTNLSARHDKVFGQLKKLLEETRLEHYVAGTEREHYLEKYLVCFMQDITHSLGGLRSAVALQAKLLAPIKYIRGAQPSYTGIDLSIPTTTERPRLINQSQIVSQADAQGCDNEPSGLTPETEPDTSSTHSLAEIFEILTSRLEVPIISHASTLKEIFTEVTFGPAPDHNIFINDGAYTRISEAVSVYREARNAVFSSICREWEMISVTEVNKAGREEMFAICEYFSVSLLELSMQLKELLSVLEKLQAEVDERPYGKSWDWLRPSWWRTDQEHVRHHLDAASSSRHYRAEVNTRSSVRTPIAIDQPERQLRGWTRYQRANGDAWGPFDIIRKDEIKFALKVGIGAALYALPSFIPVTRPFYLYWRGEWGLVSYMLVCSMTIGASNTTGFARLLGTCLGGLCSIGAWYIAGGDAFKLAMVGFIMALGPFYMIIAKGQAPMGRFILLTYNLSVLYAFSHSQADIGDPDNGSEHLNITEIVLHRVISVISGCIWGIIITRGIWPIRARTKLNETLQSLWLRLVLIWDSEPLNTIFSADASAPVLYMNPRDKIEIEHLLSQLEPLQTSARSEAELGDPFPDAAYSNAIRRTRDIVDNFYSMDLVLFDIPALSEGQISLLRYTVAARQQLSECISNLLAVIASSVQLEHTLSDFPTNVEDSRYRLLAQISQYRQDQRASPATNDEDYVLLYSYVVVSHQLSDEIAQIMAELGHIFPASDEDFVGAVRV